MLRDDALLAFERHATSKIRDVKDLLAISTLGFRGEALPSIASVSRVLVETRRKGRRHRHLLEIAGGRLLRCDEFASGSGTAITVRDLFFNVPARKKFLRSEQTELAHIASLVTHYSLAASRQDVPAGKEPRTCCRSLPSHLGARLPGFRRRDAGRADRNGRPRTGVEPRARVRAARGGAAEFQREPPRTSITRFRLSGFLSRPQVRRPTQFHLHLRERPADSRPPHAARHLVGYTT